MEIEENKANEKNEIVQEDTGNKENRREKSRRILLRVAYDGTGYHGWQVQPNARTIEGELNQAITELTGEDICVTGASRTDAGVHALGNVAVFDTCSRIPAERFCYALNRYLPGDIIVQKSKEVPADFHPRHQECRKTYEYCILNRRLPLPEYRNTAHFEYGRLDVGRMEQAGAAFTGEHDFASFCASGAQVKTTVRTIYGLEIVEKSLHPADGCLEMPAAAGQMENPVGCIPQDTGELSGEGRLILVRVCGNGFLYNMVRIIAGTLLEVGKGHICPEDMPGIIAARDRSKAGPTAPARGLKLVRIDYCR